MPRGPSASERIEALVARGDTLAGLERLLRLSPGYLSKVKHGRAAASPQLAALLELLAQHPEVRETLLGAFARDAGPTANPARGPVRARRRGDADDAFVGQLARLWRERGVRFLAVDDLLLAALGVPGPAGVEPSLRFLIHPADRHALAEARSLGACVATATTRACVCTPTAGGPGVVLVFPLEPFHALFARPKLTAIDAALYFALQAGEDAEARLRAVIACHALSRQRLERAFARRYGAASALPVREWLLRTTFDPELARDRLGRLPRQARARRAR